MRGRVALALLLAAGVAGCSVRVNTRSAARSADERAVVAAGEALFRAMEGRDTAAIRALLHPDLRITVVRVGDGEPQIRSSTASDFIASIGRAQVPIVERMWEPRVEVGRDFASLWAPYDLHRGAQFSHCGHDAFHFARLQGRWVIVGLSYTVQPTGCEPAPRGVRPLPG